MNTPEQPDAQSPDAPRPSLGSAVRRILLHGGFLIIAVGCLAAYEHFRIEGHSDAALVSLLGAAGFGFAPVRDLVRVVLRVEGKVLHVVHVVGGLALAALPLTGLVSGAPVLTQAARAPFAIMAAAQAVMHQDHPRNAKQAEALRRFAASLPEVAQFAGSNNLSSPEKSVRAVAVLSDILTKAQALGETEMESDPGFRNALSQVSTRFGANLGLDAVDLALARLEASPATASAVPALRKQLALARETIAGAGGR